MSGAEPVDAIGQSLTAFFIGGLCLGAFLGAMAQRAFTHNRYTYLLRRPR